MQRASAHQLQEKAIQNKELQQLFGQLTGTVDPDVQIIIPKFEKIFDACANIVGLIKSFCEKPVMAKLRAKYPVGFTEALAFVEECQKAMTELQLERNNLTYTSAELTEANKDPAKLAQLMMGTDLPYKIHNIQQKYKSLKACRMVKEFTMMMRAMTDLLAEERERSKAPVHCLENRETLSAAFITKADGVSLQLWPFCRIDFKLMIGDDLMHPEVKKYMIYVLHLVYNNGRELLKQLRSPDVDKQKFAEVIVDSMKNLQDVPELRHCKEAFKEINKSVNLMINNFDNYHQDFVISGSPTIILESFISDVAKTSTTGLKTSAQFAKIISYFQEKVKAKGTDNPTTSGLIKMVREYSDILDTRLKTRAKESDKPEPAEPTEAAPVVSIAPKLKAKPKNPNQQ